MINIISTEWDCNIENVEFTIKILKDFDQIKVNFPMGYKGSTYYENVEYEINNNLISGMVRKDKIIGNALNTYEGLTVRIEFPEGYFQGERKVFDPTLIIIIVLSGGVIVGLLEGLILFIKYGKRDSFILVSEYTVPDDLIPNRLFI